MDGSVQSGINLLAFDTSTDRAIIALATATGTIHAAGTDSARKHGRDLIPELRKVLDHANLKIADLHLLAVGLGPGSYTGLRVGLMAAKTLAYTSGAALVGLDSLEAIARNAPETATSVTVVADAQRGDVYSASFARSAPRQPLLRTRDTLIEPASVWADRLSTGDFVMGPGLSASKIRSIIPDGVIIAQAEATFPTVARLVEAAQTAWLAGRRDDFWTLEPLYLRRSSAEEQWDNRSPSEVATPASSLASLEVNDRSIQSSTNSPGTN